MENQALDVLVKVSDQLKMPASDLEKACGEFYIRKILAQHQGVGLSDLTDHVYKIVTMGANPLLGEVHFTSYRSKALKKRVGATVFGYRFFERKAVESGEYGGMETFVGPREYFDPVSGDTVKELCGEAIVHRKGWETPMKHISWYRECVQTKLDGTPNKFWLTMPTVMVLKVAKACALRSTFPEILGGIYIQDEYDPGAHEREIEQRESTEKNGGDFDKKRAGVISAAVKKYEEATTGLSRKDKALWLKRNYGIEHVQDLTRLTSGAVEHLIRAVR